jgi:hypothetical protein
MNGLYHSLEWLVKKTIKIELYTVGNNNIFVKKVAIFHILYEIDFGTLYKE